MIDPASKALAVVAHDAGGAHQLIAWLRHHRPGALGVRAFVQGPAAVAWCRAFPGVEPVSGTDVALQGADLLLTGTGWGSDLEHSARSRARAVGLPSVAVLDHWVNYPERFVRGGETVWPEEFWVFDSDALALAHSCFPADRVRLVENHHLNDQLAAVMPVPSGQKPVLLYVLEPARSNWGRSLAGEFQALDYLADCWHRLDLPPDTVCRLRPHPSDPPGKYAAWIAGQTRLVTELDTSTDLAHALSQAAWVAGCETHAMVVALAAGRRVYCTLPPWAPACRLPHRGLVHLKELG